MIAVCAALTYSSEDYFAVAATSLMSHFGSKSLEDTGAEKSSVLFIALLRRRTTA
jgi:hypothetical protein